jgi:hypothetical protein
MMKEGMDLIMYRRNVNLSFKSFVSALLAVLLLAASVSTQTTAPTFPERPHGQQPGKDVIFSTEVLRQSMGRRDGRPKIASQEGVGPDGIFVPSENRTGKDLKSGAQESKLAGQQKAKPGRTIVVRNTDDDGPGSLRQALREASDGNKINIVAKGTITLTSGELVVDKSVTIRGHGAAKLSVSGNSSSRVFHIMPNTTVTISGMSIINGSPSGSFPANSGGGIYNDHAELNVSSCIVNGNSARYGGGIFSDGENGTATVTVNNSTLNGNTAVFYGGGILNGGDFGSATATLNNTTVSDNSGLYGAGIFNAGFSGNATAVLNNSAVNNNTAAVNNVSTFAGGGGIYNNGDSGFATLSLTNSTVRANSVIGFDDLGGENNGGGIYNDGLSTISPGNATVTIINSSVRENKADFGGGINNDGYTGNATLTIRNSDLSRNDSVLGGGIINNGNKGRATLTITESILNSNIAASGGGIINLSGYEGVAILTITNSTLSGNVGYDEGGGILNEGIGGSAMVTIDNSALSGNHGRRRGGGINNASADASFDIDDPVRDGTATVTVTNSTLSGNSAGNEPSGEDPNFVPGEGGAIFNVGFASGTATVKLTNGTLSGNSTNNLSGGIHNLAYEEGNATAALNNCTLNDNSANNGGGSVSNWGEFGEGWGLGNATLDVANTILNAGASGNFQNLSGTLISRGYNLSSDAADGDGSTGPGGLLNGPGDIRNTNPFLGPLQDNGGPTLTHALLPYSSAIDAGDPLFNPAAFDPPFLYDQRNSRRFPRVVNGRIDIGSFERKHPGDDADDRDDDEP